MRNCIIQVVMFSGLLATCAGAKDPIKAEEIETIRARFEHYTAWNEANEKAAQKMGDRQRAEIFTNQRDLNGLRFLLVLERDLALLAAAEVKLVEAGDDAGIPHTDKNSVPELRQEIRDAERRKIRADLRFFKVAKDPDDYREHRSHARKLNSSEKAIASLELKLDARFDRIRRRLDDETKKLRKKLDRERRASRPDEKKIAEVQEELELLKQRKKNAIAFYFGPQLVADRSVVGGVPASENEAVVQLLGEIGAVRARLVRILRGEVVRAAFGEKKEATIGGTIVHSANLGVVLDISPSMRFYIDPLKKEIAKAFDAPHYQEVRGCRLVGQTLSASLKRVYAQLSGDSMMAIEKLIVVDQVDTVYWFCDLMDGHDYAAFRRLRELLRQYDVAFHVKSIGRRVDRHLLSLQAKE